MRIQRITVFGKLFKIVKESDGKIKYHYDNVYTKCIY